MWHMNKLDVASALRRDKTWSLCTLEDLPPSQHVACRGSDHLARVLEGLVYGADLDMLQVSVQQTGRPATRSRRYSCMHTQWWVIWRGLQRGIASLLDTDLHITPSSTQDTLSKKE